MERWCHGRVNPNNQEQVKLFQAVSRTAGNESRQASQHTEIGAFNFTHSSGKDEGSPILPSKAPTSVVNCVIYNADTLKVKCLFKIDVFSYFDDGWFTQADILTIR